LPCFWEIRWYIRLYFQAANYRQMSRKKRNKYTLIPRHIISAD